MRASRLLGNNRGDTIVEVLLAIAVISSVLGGAFVSANQSARGARVSQERGEALKLIEGQLERLKAAAKDDAKAGPVFASTDDFCLSDSLDLRPVGHADCTNDPDGRYTLTINRNGETFTASARWEKISGGQEEVNIVYRAYQL